MRCPRWLGLPKGGLGRAPNLRQVPGGLWEGYTSADLESVTSDSWLLSKQKGHSLSAAPSSPEPVSGEEDSSEEEVYKTL